MSVASVCSTRGCALSRPIFPGSVGTVRSHICLFEALTGLRGRPGVGIRSLQVSVCLAIRADLHLAAEVEIFGRFRNFCFNGGLAFLAYGWQPWLDELRSIRISHWQ